MGKCHKLKLILRHLLQHATLQNILIIFQLHVQLVLMLVPQVVIQLFALQLIHLTLPIETIWPILFA